MFLVTAEFNKIVNNADYKKSIFKNLTTNEKFEEYIKLKLNTNNVINYITSIARVENVINGVPINQGVKISITCLLQKINLVENKDKLISWLNKSNIKNKLKKLINIDNINNKLTIVMGLAKVTKQLTTNCNDRIKIPEYNAGSNAIDDLKSMKNDLNKENKKIKSELKDESKLKSILAKTNTRIKKLGNKIKKNIKEPDLKRIAITISLTIATYIVLFGMLKAIKISVKNIFNIVSNIKIAVNVVRKSNISVTKKALVTTITLMFISGVITIGVQGFNYILNYFKNK